MSKLILIILLLLNSGCGHSIVQEEKNIYTGVDVSLDDSQNLKVRIEPESSIGTYGPELENTNQYSNISKKEKSIGVIIAPANYRSVLALDLLKCFQINDLKVNLISGAGFGALLAAMYAQKISSEEIRWKVTNKINEMKETKNLSRDWTKEWSKFIETNINEQKIVSSDISLWLPEVKGESVKYKSSNKVKKELVKNLNPEGKNYTLNYNILSSDILNKLPVDRVVVLDSMSQKMIFNNPNELLIGVYGKIFSFTENESSNETKVVQINVKALGALDDITQRIHLNELKGLCNQVLEAIN